MERTDDQSISNMGRLVALNGRWVQGLQYPLEEKDREGSLLIVSLIFGAGPNIKPLINRL